MQTLSKVGLLAAVAALSACSCLKSPDLNVAAANDSKYAEGTAQGSGMAGNSGMRGANAQSVKDAFAAGNYSPVFFDLDSAAITDSAAGKLKEFAGFAKQNDVKGVTIEGNCDERGTREYNLALGDRRAVAVKKYLVGLGMDAGQFTTISYGKERPSCEEHTEDCWAKNRNGTLVLQ